ncbi:MAG: hypothetical protein HYV97_04585 [Bdellovibrio sp.]|nr:hypothetical protein [Bdellovibrio sp.]
MYSLIFSLTLTALVISLFNVSQALELATAIKPAVALSFNKVMTAEEYNENMKVLYKEYTLGGEEPYANVPGIQKTGRFPTPRGIVEFNYKLVKGFAITNGDILLEPKDEVTASSSVNVIQSNGIARAKTFALTGVANWQYLWPKMRVPYELSSALSGELVTKIKEAIAHWEAKTQFRFVAKTSADKKNYLFIGAGGSDMSSTEGMAHIGMRYNCPEQVKDASKPCINFMWLGSSVSTGTIIHEFGHVVGLFHEQSRLDRDKYVSIHWGRIQDGKSDNFEKYNKHENYAQTSGQDIGPYDYNSIMHYGSYSFAKWKPANIVFTFLGFPSSWQDPTITTINGDIIYANRSGLSTLDLMGIHKMYSSSCGGILPDAYGTLGVAATKFSLELERCQERTFFHHTDDYMDLSLNITPQSGNTVSLTNNKFSATFVSNDKDGYEETYSAKPVGNGRQLKQNLLLPGKQILKFSSLNQEAAKLSVDFKLVQSVLAKDKYEATNFGNNDIFKNSAYLDGAILEGNHPLVTNTISNLTLHNSTDVDYFEVKIPEDQLVNHCPTNLTVANADLAKSVVKSQAKARPFGPKTSGNSTQVSYTPAKLTISLSRKDVGRILKISLFDTDGKLVQKEFFSDGKDLKEWKSKNILIKCPHSKFKNDTVIVKVEDIGGKRNIYDLSFHYTETTKDIPPIKVNGLQYQIGVVRKSGLPEQKLAVPNKVSQPMLMIGR